MWPGLHRIGLECFSFRTSHVHPRLRNLAAHFEACPLQAKAPLEKPGCHMTHTLFIKEDSVDCGFHIDASCQTVAGFCFRRSPCPKAPPPLFSLALAPSSLSVSLSLSPYPSKPTSLTAEAAARALITYSCFPVHRALVPEQSSKSHTACLST